MAKPHVVVVGADKGGVGKTTVSRTLMDYFKSKGSTLRGIDTQPGGSLKRFFPDNTTILDLAKSDDQMKVFDTLREAQVSLIDCRAGLLSELLYTLDEIGFLDSIKDDKLAISVLHILGSSQASLDEIAQMAKLVKGARHFLVLNKINDAAFMGLTDDMKKVGNGLIEIGQLNTLAADTVDRLGMPFDAYVAAAPNAERHVSPTLQGYVRAWEKRCFDAFDAQKLAV